MLKENYYLKYFNLFKKNRLMNNIWDRKKNKEKINMEQLIFDYVISFKEIFFLFESKLATKKKIIKIIKQMKS